MKFKQHCNFSIKIFMNCIFVSLYQLPVFETSSFIYRVTKSHTSFYPIPTIPFAPLLPYRRKRDVWHMICGLWMSFRNTTDIRDYISNPTIFAIQMKGFEFGDEKRQGLMSTTLPSPHIYSHFLINDTLCICRYVDLSSNEHGNWK